MNFTGTLYTIISTLIKVRLGCMQVLQSEVAINKATVVAVYDT